MKKNFLIVFVSSIFGLSLLFGCQKEKVTASGELNGHSYVDLGLPSGTLWATCNVGADNPKEEGDHYSWGETRTKGSYSWNNYKFAQGGDGWNGYLNKYCTNAEYGVNGFTDYLTKLVASDDVATVLWGEGWRMPTKNELSELFSECSWCHTKYHGTEGVLFTGFNGNLLFFPDVEYGCEDGIAGGGGYWSSILDTERPTCAYRLYVHYDSYEIWSEGRNYGFSVRPVASGR